jgi:beta-lactam-binding protein with PASTA domain/predicted Ser/Thr protein kinase
VSGTGIDQGEMIDGRYRIQSRLGTGGMADVFLADDTQLERQVALKLLHRRFAEDPGFVERFRREAQAAANLQHPNVVSVYDRGSWDGTYYIAMEYLRGRTLKQVVREEAPLDPVRAIDITIQILKATRFAHRRGIIHRDLKPHNVMLDDQDHAKVADFGIARAGASDMTETGSIMGTAQYLSPEQAQGLAVGEGSDLYSVGVVLYELLTGHVPFDAESAVTIALKHVSEAPPPPSGYNPELPPALEQTVLWALNKDPADRPQDADQFINVLEGVRESLHSGGGGQVTANMAALAAGALGGAAAAGAVGGTAAGTGPHPRVQLGARDLTAPSTAMHPLPGESGALPALGAPVTEPSGSRRRGEPQRRSRWSRVWPWLLGLVVVLLTAGGVVAFLLTRTTKDTIPVVVNLSQQLATAKVEAAGFNPTVIQQVSTSPEGDVIYQSPLGGTRVKSGTTVDLTVSSGPGSTSVPAVVQLSRTQAVAQLHLARLKVSRILTEPSTSIPKGEATRTDPDAGTDLQAGQGVVLYISTGVAPVSIPGVTGDTVQTARSALSAFTVTVTQKASSTVTPGTVISQTPDGGVTALPGATVTLVVAEKEPTVAVTEVVGETLPEATAALTSLGLKVTHTLKLTTVAGEGGEVLSQNPAPNAKVTEGSTVTLVVAQSSKGTNSGTTSTPSSTTTTTPPVPTTTAATTTSTTGTDTAAEASTSTNPTGLGGVL